MEGSQAEKETPASRGNGRESGFRELIRYTVPGYAVGLLSGLFLDLAGLSTNPYGQWLVRSISGESESIFEGLYAFRKRISRSGGSLSEAYGWGKLIGMAFPWFIDALSRFAGVEVNGVEGFYVPYFYALSDQIGANVSGIIYLKRVNRGFGKTVRAYFSNPVMTTSLAIVTMVPLALFLGRIAGFRPSTQTLTAAETILANLCWVPPLAGWMSEKKSLRS